VNAPVLKEYGFVRLEKAAYTRDDGRNLTIRAAVFEDASGAYGAFTYYYSPEMEEETIGGQAAFLNNRVLFYQGNVLVDAVFDRMSVMSASQLRQLAGLLPQAVGGKNNPPSLPGYLPKRAFEKNLEKNTTKYILGPVALDRVGSPLPASMVDFKSGAEVVMGKYAVNAGDATLMLIEYPTPQIAAERLRQIDASHQVTQQQPGVCVDCRCGPVLRRAHRSDPGDRGRTTFKKRSALADVVDQLRGRCHVERKHLREQERQSGELSVQRDYSLRNCGRPGAGCRDRVWGLAIARKTVFPRLRVRSPGGDGNHLAAPGRYPPAGASGAVSDSIECR
jgi:hypothetical protein